VAASSYYRTYVRFDARAHEVTRPASEVEAVLKLVAEGLNDCAISRAIGIPRRTILDWRHHGGRPAEFAGRRLDSDCPICYGDDLDAGRYAYLLGLYLGDGCINECPRGVFKLRITLDLKYPGIISDCADAMRTMRPKGKCRVGYGPSIGCVHVTSYWKHWPCVFPQHGPGPKHRRPIILRHWQEDIAAANPDLLLQGLIHSDGCRDLNWVNGKSYPRYQFTNNSPDIRAIFRKACDDFRVHYSLPYWNTVSVARRPDVAKLDGIIGPKR
jgi:hypothetical protein